MNDIIVFVHSMNHVGSGKLKLASESHLQNQTYKTIESVDFHDDNFNELW